MKPSYNLAVADAALPDHVYYNPGYQLRWEVSFDGQHLWFPIGTTHHEVYGTLAAPTGQRLESMYHIAVLEAEGESEVVPARDAIWANFATRLVQRKDGGLLGYYRNIACSTHLNGSITASSLLSVGNGQCGSWAELLGSCFRIHSGSDMSGELSGIFVTPNTSFLPSCEGGGLGFIVKDYQFMEPGTSPCPSFPYRFNSPCGLGFATWPQSEVTDLLGAEGQSSSNPASFFGNHRIIHYQSQIFDPSYGAGPYSYTHPALPPPYPTCQAWGNASISGFVSFSENLAGAFRLVIRKKNMDEDDMYFTPYALP